MIFLFSTSGIEPSPFRFFCSLYFQMSPISKKTLVKCLLVISRVFCASQSLKPTGIWVKKVIYRGFFMPGTRIRHSFRLYHRVKGWFGHFDFFRKFFSKWLTSYPKQLLESGFFFQCVEQSELNIFMCSLVSQTLFNIDKLSHLSIFIEKFKIDHLRKNTHSS